MADISRAEVEKLKEKWADTLDRNGLVARAAFDGNDKNLMLLLSGKGEAINQFLADLTALLEATND
jgi:hypothetical protein